MNRAKLKNLPIQIIDGDRSSRYPKRDEFQEDGVLFLNTTNIVDNRLDLSDANFITHDKFSQLGKGKLKPLDIVMTTRGSIGKVALFNHPAQQTGFINAQMLIFRADGKVIDPFYLYYLLCSSDIQGLIKNFASGSAQPQIPMVDLKEIEIAYPEFSTQRRIADILSAYDDLIENNTRRIRILEQMAQAIYQEWFGNEDKNWKMAHVGDIMNLCRGKSYRSEDLADEGGLPFLNLKCIQRDGGFRRDGIKRFIGEYKDINTAKAGDVVVALTDMTQERRIVARAARVPKTSEDLYVMSMDLIRLEPKEGIPQSYLYAMLRFSKFPDEVKQHANGVNVLHLSPDRIAQFEFALPPKSLRDKFSEIAEPIFNECDLLEKKNDNLRQTRDLLLPRLVSGEIELQ